MNFLEIKTTLSLDPIHKRAFVSRNGTSRSIINGTISLTKVDKCLNYVVDIRANLADIFSPITIKIGFDTKYKISEIYSKFCTSCVIIDPKNPKTVNGQITFTTGCKGEKCVHDLSVVGTLQNVTQPFILGSDKTVKIKYEIKNIGEPAYSTHLKIEIFSNLTQFSKIPPSCSHDWKVQNVMTCNIKNRKPIMDKEVAKLDITIDVTNLEGKLLKITAEVTSVGDEQQPVDNKFVNEIPLAEFSNVALNG